MASSFCGESVQLVGGPGREPLIFPLYNLAQTSTGCLSFFHQGKKVIGVKGAKSLFYLFSLLSNSGCAAGK